MLDAIASQIAVTVSSLEVFDLLSESADRLGTMLRQRQLEAAKSRAILEGVADGVMVTEANGRISLFNVAGERILGLSRSQVINRSKAELPGLFDLAGTSWSDLARTWSQGDGSGTEGFYEERVDFGGKAINIRIAPVFRQGMFEGTVSVFRDITKDVEVDRLKSEFVSMVSHELRTPMTSIKGYVDLLHSGMAGSMTDGQLHFLAKAKNNADRLTVLVNGLLDISRLDAGAMALDLDNVNVLEIIERVVDELKPRATERGQSLEVLAGPPLPLVRADPHQVARIVTNLVDNALKYTPQAGQVVVDAQTDGEFLWISVRDTGMGISAADQEKLFSRFFRTERAVRSGTGGAGLGLYITRSLVELHGGDIWVDSREDQGSTFTFSLPLTAETDAQAAPEPEFKTISYRSGDRQILIVEGEGSVASQAMRRLQQLGGYRVQVLKRGRAALDYVNGNRRRIDLIALDMELPDMDGRDLLRALQAGSAVHRIPVIAIAKDSPGSEVERKRILDLGAVRLLARPFQVADLVGEIEQVLSDRTDLQPSVEEAG
jgi:PAS domain S-box-containing protein